MLGDCGSWVINAINGDIYGHIVAGDITSGLAYMIPAYKVFNDIELRFGLRPVLPGQTVTDEPGASEHRKERSHSLISSGIFEGHHRFPQRSQQASTELGQGSEGMYSIASRHTEHGPSSSGKSHALKQPVKAATTPSSPSFVVKIEALRPNYSIQPNRSTHDKNPFFLPPDRRTAFYKGDADYFRWHGGRMSILQNLPINIVRSVTAHSSATIFSQKDDTDHLLAVGFNATITDVASYDPGWRVLSFDHIPKPKTAATYSSINILGEERHLAAPGSTTWMRQLLPHEYDYQRTAPNGHPIPSPTTSAGLIGSLPILIGLAAFSAPQDSLTAVLTSSIIPRAWIRHNLPTGRTPERGMVVTIYYDLMNRASSTMDILDRLENGEFGPFYA